MKPADRPEARRQPLQRLALCLVMLLSVTVLAACNGDAATAPDPTAISVLETLETTRHPSTATIAPSLFTATPVEPTATVQPTDALPTATVQPTDVPPTPTVPNTPIPSQATPAPPPTATVLYTPTVPLATPVIVETPTAQPHSYSGAPDCNHLGHVLHRG